MTLRLALASAPVPVQERYGQFAGVGSTQPSFGLLCLAAVARRAGHAVRVVDASADNLGPAETTKVILDFNPDVVGLSATTAGIMACGELAQRLKQSKPDLLTVIGGCHVSAIPEETLAEFPAFDLAILGEGELTLLELLERRQSGGPLPADLPGTATRNPDGSLHRNPPRDLIMDLDTLPLPAWDLLPGFPGAYNPSPLRIRRWPCASVVLTRGCPNRCVFCDRSVFGNRCRAYSPSHAVQLLRDLYDNHGVREILIEDDTFVIAKDRVRAFCEELIAARIELSWSCLGRADRVDLDLLKLMRRAGCWHISFGIESGDPEILAAMHKHLDLGQVRQALAWSRAASLRTKGFFIVGFPRESEASLRKTRELACALPLDDISVMQMTPFPGSELYAVAGEFGTFERNWRHMNAVDTVFVPRGFTRADMEAARSGMIRAFYLRPGMLARHAWFWLRNPRILRRLLGGAGGIFRMLWPARRGKPAPQDACDPG